MKPNCYCIDGDKPHFTQGQVDQMLADERERLIRLCLDWARICEYQKRWGCKCGAEECAELIRKNPK